MLKRHNSEFDIEREPYMVKPERASARGVLLTLLMALGLMSISTGLARYLFPQGENGKAPTSGDMQSAVDAMESQLGEHANEMGRRGSFAASGTGHTTEQCCGDTELPVLKGADVVAYFSMQEDASAMFGYKEHTSVYNGYRFYFVSEENKMLFEERPLRYIPAWGGFCSWGIASEDWWTADTLGPDADPNSWLITTDLVLHIFRSELPKSKFVGNITANIEKGNSVWSLWFEDDVPGAAGSGSPMDTACFCNRTTCNDW